MSEGRLSASEILKGLHLSAHGLLGTSYPCMSLSIFLVLRQPNGKMGHRFPGRGSGGGAGVIDLPSDLLSPFPSLIHPRFCVQNSNRCLSGVLNAPARIRKNESEHNRTYD